MGKEYDYSPEFTAVDENERYRIAWIQDSQSRYTYTLVSNISSAEYIKKIRNDRIKMKRRKKSGLAAPTPARIKKIMSPFGVVYGVR